MQTFALALSLLVASVAASTEAQGASSGGEASGARASARASATILRAQTIAFPQLQQNPSDPRAPGPEGSIVSRSADAVLVEFL